MNRQFLPYRSSLKAIARTLRKEMTLAEVLLWSELKRKQMLGYDFHRQKPIDQYVVDFFCPKLLLVIEIDGASHVGKQEEDSRRQKEIEQCGISSLRFSDKEVKQNLNGVLACIREWIAAREGVKGRRQVSNAGLHYTLLNPRSHARKPVLQRGLFKLGMLVPNVPSRLHASCHREGREVVLR